MVHRAEEREHSLFSRVRNAEYARQKQEQSVRKAQQELYEIKRQNAQKIKEEMSQLTKQEQELEQKLLREQAQLAKVSFVFVVLRRSINNQTSKTRLVAVDLPVFQPLVKYTRNMDPKNYSHDRRIVIWPLWKCKRHGTKLLNYFYIWLIKIKFTFYCLSLGLCF